MTLIAQKATAQTPRALPGISTHAQRVHEQTHGTCDQAKCDDTERPNQHEPANAFGPHPPPAWRCGDFA